MGRLSVDLCGIRLDNFLDFVEGDIIQIYEIELKKASL